MARPSWNAWRAAGLLLVLGVALGACGSDDDGAAVSTSTTEQASTTTEAAAPPTTEAIASPTTEAASPSTTEAGAPDAGDRCALAAPLLIARERPYIGSAEHVGELQALRDVTTGEEADDLDVLIAHYTHDVDPSRPSSQDVENFPADVQATALRVQERLTTTC